MACSSQHVLGCEARRGSRTGRRWMSGVWWVVKAKEEIWEIFSSKLPTDSFITPGCTPGFYQSNLLRIKYRGTSRGCGLVKYFWAPSYLPSLCFSLEDFSRLWQIYTWARPISSIMGLIEFSHLHKQAVINSCNRLQMSARCPHAVVFINHAPQTPLSVLPD